MNATVDDSTVEVRVDGEKYRQVEQQSEEWRLQATSSGIYPHHSTRSPYMQSNKSILFIQLLLFIYYIAQLMHDIYVY